MPFGRYYYGRGNRQHVVETTAAAPGWRMISVSWALREICDPILGDLDASAAERLERIATVVADTDLSELIAVNPVAAFALVEYERGHVDAISIAQDIRPVVSFGTAPGMRIAESWSYLQLLGPGELVEDSLRAPIVWEVAGELVEVIDADGGALFESKIRAVYAEHGAYWPWGEDDE